MQLKTSPAEMKGGRESFGNYFLDKCRHRTLPAVMWCDTVFEADSHLGVTEGAGVVKRDQTAVVPRVHVGARLQQVLHHVLTSET